MIKKQSHFFAHTALAALIFFIGAVMIVKGFDTFYGAALIASAIILFFEK
jgi:hypothetical protein